ncbi:hypothetical protein [Reyranella sp.]|uniref:hypothetical protein n=1 Tax=Reyranella sp. TaxID=1929291 RepID=UPI003BAB5025
MKFVTFLVAVVAFAGHAVAQHSHGSMKGPNGGPMQDVAGVHAELLVSGKVLTINLLDEDNKPVSAKGFSGTLLVVSGGSRETVPLAVSGVSSLKGEAKNAVPAGANVSLVLKSVAGKSGQAKF